MGCRAGEVGHIGFGLHFRCWDSILVDVNNSLPEPQPQGAEVSGEGSA